MKAFLVIAFLTVAGSASAQAAPPPPPAPCAPLERLQAMLLEKYNEVPSGMGLVGVTSLITLFESPNGDTWTLATIGADGNACIIGAGQYWSYPPEPPVPGARES